MSRWRLLAVGVLIALGVIGYFVVNEGVGLDPEACATGCEPLQPPEIITEDALVRRYAPILYLRNQSAACRDDGDPFDPVPVDVVLGNPAITLRNGRDLVKSGPTAADLFRGDSNLQMDYPGDPTRLGCRYELDSRQYSEGKPRIAYTRTVLAEDEPLLAVQYWFYYYFNDWNNRHEGDWEMVQLVFEAETLRQA